MRFRQHLNESNTDITRKQESLFCVGVGISQIKSSVITEQDILNADLFHRSMKSYVQVDANESELYDFALKNSDWTKSVVLSVNALRKSPYYKSRYVCYRTIGIMAEVYKQAARLLKADGIRMQADKWNPGDVWLSKSGFNIPNHDNLMEFNKFISDSLKSGNLLPVSLKKTTNAKVYFISNTNEMKYYQYRGVVTPTTPFNVGVIFKTDDPKLKIDCRTFGINEVASITCELLIKGSDARHSKATPLPLIKKWGVNQTPKKTFEKWGKDPMMGDIAKNMIVQKWAGLGVTWSSDKIEKLWQRRLNEGKNMAGFYRGIINALELTEYLESHKDHAEYFVNDTIKRASSIVDVSSDHLKIY